MTLPLVFYQRVVVDWRPSGMTTAQARDWMNDLMADAAWTRRLATSLLGDPDAAEDARQDAWLKTRGQRTRDLDNPRGWVRTVFANALRSQRRAQLRRRSREQVALAVSEAAPSPEELLGRLEVQKTLATLVTGLEEPGRQMVLLHYYEGLTSVQIAAATGAPAGTVRWRLKAALAELRTQLERHYGPRERDWRLALLPLAPGVNGQAGAAASAPAPPRRSPVLIAGGAALGLLITLLTAGLRLDWFATPGENAPALTLEDGETPAAIALERRKRQGRASFGGPAPVLSAAALARDCPEDIAALGETVREARSALAYHLPSRFSLPRREGPAQPGGDGGADTDHEPLAG